MQIGGTRDISIEKEVQREDHYEREKTRCEIVLAWLYSLQVVVDERLVLLRSHIQVVLTSAHVHGEKPLEETLYNRVGFKGSNLALSFEVCILPSLLLSLFLLLFEISFTLFHIFLIPLEAWRLIYIPIDPYIVPHPDCHQVPLHH